MMAGADAERPCLHYDAEHRNDIKDGIKTKEREKIKNGKTPFL
jgi:hypothetical protein